MGIAGLLVILHLALFPLFFMVVSVFFAMLGSTLDTCSVGTLHPVSSGKYSGTFVFTAPVAEPIVMSFTVPLDGYTIDATATVVASYSSSADCPGSAAPLCCERVSASRCRVVVDSLSWWCLRFYLGQCEADGWKIPHHLFPVPRGCWVCLHAEFLVQQQLPEFALTTTSFPCLCRRTCVAV